MEAIKRISPAEVKRKLQSGSTFLVCAYEDETKCKQIRLQNSLTLQEFRSRLGSLPKSQDIIFYCA